MKQLLFFVLLFSSFYLLAQEDAWVFFKDKPQAKTFLENPTSMLSPHAIERRRNQNIAITLSDVPVDNAYYQYVKSEKGIVLLAKSKWLNAVHVRGTEDAIAALQTNFSFIDRIEFADKTLNKKVFSGQVKYVSSYQNKFENMTSDFDYGNATDQITMIKANVLHEQELTGSGIRIAIMDAGFPNVNTLSAFERLRRQEKLLGGYNFVERKEDFYTGHQHGTNVLSDIAGYLEGDFVGTAPDAAFYLFITEDVASETPLEESLWVEAAETADSLGVDIINTSLGYSVFDNAAYNYRYSDMDGATSFIARGAEIAASKGMILVTSAGNSGNKNWKYITTPADAKAVFTVGAVDAAEAIAPFSSFGPTADGRVKPDVVGHGQGVYVIDHVSGLPQLANGTSFSAPIIAGAMACFWQAFPAKSSTEIMEAIRNSSDRYANPTDQYGYGIPDFELAFAALSNTKYSKERVTVFPNPVENTLYLQSDIATAKITIYSILGKQVLQTVLQQNTIDVSKFPAGMYVVQIDIDGTSHVKTWIKK